LYDKNYFKTHKVNSLGKAPWRTTTFPNTAEIMLWIDQFPDLAGKNKTPDKPEGTSFGDLSIIQEFHKSCNLFPMSEVFIWSLDSDLRNYHQIDYLPRPK
jgi:hypothetical protein